MWSDGIEDTPYCIVCATRMRLTMLGQMDTGCYVILQCPNTLCRDIDMCWGCTPRDAYRRIYEARKKDAEREAKRRKDEAQGSRPALDR